MLIIFARERGFRALLPDDPELLRREHGLPLAVRLLDVVLCCVLLLLGGGEEGSHEGQCGQCGHGADRCEFVGEGLLEKLDGWRMEVLDDGACEVGECEAA